MTKINARSPYFLSYGEPTVPSPEFTCDVAKGSVFSLTISQRGEIDYNDLAFGTIANVSSTDAGFANGKYADVTSPTDRTVVLKIAIPQGFSNSSDGFLNCSIAFQQPPFVSGTTCTVNTSLNGTIANQSLATNGTTTSALDLSTKFTAGSSAITGYRIVNEYENLVTVTAVTTNGGASQSIQFTTQNSCGVAHIQIYAVDALSNSCDVFQNAQITVTGCTVAFGCTGDDSMSLQGGSIAQNGVLTMPTGTQPIPATGSVSANADGSNPISGSQPFTISQGANTGSSARDITLYFLAIIPAGYTNTGDGSQQKWCPLTFSQQAASTLPAFTCTTANISEGTISTIGSIGRPKIQIGTIESFLPIGFDTVTEDKPRDVTFQIRVPNEAAVYSNPNALIPCTIEIKQPAYVADCGTNNIYLTGGFADGTGGCLIDAVCDNTFPATTACTCNNNFDNITIGDRICLGGKQAFKGKSLWHGVQSSPIDTGAGLGAGIVKFIKIGATGLVESIASLDCAGGCGSGGIQ